MLSLLKKLIPVFIKNKIKSFIHKTIYVIKAPRMIWGHLDSNGEWRARTRISDTVFFYHPERISIADNVFIWHYSIMDGTGGLTIEEGCQIGAWVGIFTHSSHISIRLYGNHYQEIPEALKKGYMTGPVIIGKYAFIGAGCRIFPGTKIGKGVLISAGSTVNKDINDFSIISGDSEIIGDTRKLDKRFLKDPQLQAWYDEWQKN